MIAIRSRAAGFVLTHDDLMALDLLARFGYMTTAQLARALGRPRLSMYRRVDRMVEARLLRRSAWVRGNPDLLVPTGRGIMTAGYVEERQGRPRPTLRPPQVKLGMVRHTLLAADAAVTYMLLGHRAVSEREIYRADGRDRRRDDWLAPLTYSPFHASGRDLPYSPDLAIVPDVDASQISTLQGGGTRRGALRPEDPFQTLSQQEFLSADGRPLTFGNQFPILRDSGKPFAVEVELTRKSVPEYTSILEGYAGATHLAGVVWYVASTGIRDALVTAAARVQMPSARWRVMLLVPWQPVHVGLAAE